MKKLLMLFSCLMLTMGLMAGCGGGAADDVKDDTATAGWDYIQQKGELVVGLDDTFAPMGFRDADNNLVGFDIDLAIATGEVLGVDVKFQPISWDAKELELSSKNIDCIWNGMSATPERQESMALTNKYLNNKIVIMTLDENLSVTTVEDLQNITMATQAGSAALETMMANEAWDTFATNVVEYPTYDEALLAMQGGRVQAIVVDQVLGEYKNANIGGQMIVADYNFGDDFYAIGCRQGETDVAEKINEALQTLIDNGKAAEISDKWFGTNIVILEDYE